MTQKDNGGPAFPLQSIGPYFPPGHSGMTLRDWFAGQALAGIAANPVWTGCNTDEVVMSAYHLADAMLAERGK